MRGTLPGLPTPHPLLDRLPAVYLDQDFLGRFLAALDEVLAPVLLVLDSLHAYFDPRTAPEDFLAWLAAWTGVEVDGDLPVGQRRAAVAGAVAGHGWRGTARGVREAVALHTGSVPEVAETGGATWSSTPDGPLPGTSPAEVVVRVRAGDADRADLARLEQVVAAEVPAHVRVRVDVLDGTSG